MYPDDDDVGEEDDPIGEDDDADAEGDDLLIDDRLLFKNVDDMVITKFRR